MSLIGILLEILSVDYQNILNFNVHWRKWIFQSHSSSQFLSNLHTFLMLRLCFLCISSSIIFLTTTSASSEHLKKIFWMTIDSYAFRNHHYFLPSRYSNIKKVLRRTGDSFTALTNHLSHVSDNHKTLHSEFSICLLLKRAQRTFLVMPKGGFLTSGSNFSIRVLRPEGDSWENVWQQHTISTLNLSMMMGTSRSSWNCNKPLQ